MDEETIAEIRKVIDDWTGRVKTLVSPASIEDDWRLADLPDVGDTWWWHVDGEPKYRVVVHHLTWDGVEWMVHVSKVGDGVVRGYRVSEWWEHVDEDNRRRTTDEGRLTGGSDDD